MMGWYDEIMSGGVSTVEKLYALIESSDVNEKNPAGDTFLHHMLKYWMNYAWIEGYEKVATIKKIINAKAALASIDLDGNAPLHVACETAFKCRFDNSALDFDSLSGLISAGSDLNAKNKKGETPLFTFLKAMDRSVQFLDIDTLKMLMSKENMNEKESEGETPLSFILKRSSLSGLTKVKLLKALLEEGLTMTTEEGKYYLECAHEGHLSGKGMAAIYDAMFSTSVSIQESKNETEVFHLFKKARKLIFLTGPEIVSAKENKSGEEERAPILPLIEAIRRKYVSNHIDVKLIGNGELPLTQQELDQFFEVLSDTTEPLTVILNAHGTPHLSPTSSYDRHLMILKEGAAIASLDFLQKIAAVRKDKPIDIFSCSCFGGLMQPFIKHILPTGSVYVSLNSDLSKVNFITALLEWMGADNTSFPTRAEELLLILFTKMSHSRDGSHYFQDISISSVEFSLNLQDNVVAHLNVQFSLAEMERINKQVGCFVEKKTLEKIRKKIEESPAIIDFRSQKHFNEYEYGLALAMCYAAKRDLSERQPVAFMFERKRRRSEESTKDQIPPSAANAEHKRKKIN